MPDHPEEHPGKGGKKASKAFPFAPASKGGPRKPLRLDKTPEAHKPAPPPAHDEAPVPPPPSDRVLGDEKAPAGAGKKPLPTLIDPYTNKPILPVSQREAEENLSAPAGQDEGHAAPPSIGPKEEYAPPPPPSAEMSEHGYHNPAAEEIMAAPAEYFFEMPPPRQSIVPPVAVAGAGAVAFIGGVLWVAFSLAIGVEFVWLALLVGVGIGFTSSYLGGRGKKMGLICAGFAIASLMIARVAIVRILWTSIMMTPGNIALSSTFAEDLYEENYAIASEYAAIENEDDLRRFLVRNDMVYSSSPDAVTDEEMNEFLNSSLPDELQDFYDNNPTFEEWQNNARTTLKAMAPPAPGPLQLLKYSFGPYDLLILWFGAGAAFFIGGAKDGDA